MKHRKVFNTVFFLALSIFFTAVIFLGITYFTYIPEQQEERFIEQSIHEDEFDHNNEDVEYSETIIEDNIDSPEVQEGGDILQNVDDKGYPDQSEFEVAREINFGFVPDNFSSDQLGNQTILTNSIRQGVMKEFISQIGIVLYEKKVDVRGKMSDKTVRLYGPQKMEDDELLGVFFHEFAHYVDLYFLKRTSYSDISNNFYDVSWYSTVVMLPGQQQANFVSGYAMTNKYEDFAESMTYYILHNDDFKQKANESDVLMKKYNFFDKWIFTNGEFIGTDFSQGNIVESYYRDTTKIDFSSQNFLQYLQKSI